MEVTILTEDGEVTESGIVRVKEGALGGVLALRSVGESGDLFEVIEETDGEYYANASIIKVSEE